MTDDTALPQAPGESRLSSLQAGGFSTDDVNAYQTRVSAQMQSAGFRQDEINNYWGIKTPDTTNVQQMATQSQQPGSMTPQNPAVRQDIVRSYQNGETRNPGEYLESALRSSTSALAWAMNNTLHPINQVEKAATGAENYFNKVGDAVQQTSERYVGTTAYPFVSSQNQQAMIDKGIVPPEGGTPLPPGASTATKIVHGIAQGFGSDSPLGTALSAPFMAVSAPTAPLLDMAMQAGTEKAKSAGLPSADSTLIPDAAGIVLNMFGLKSMPHMLAARPSLRTPEEQTAAGPWSNVPHAQDFVDGAASTLGPKAETEVSQVMRNIYAEQGIHPAQVAQDAQSTPTIAQDLAAGQIPEAYKPQPTVPAPVNEPTSPATPVHGNESTQPATGAGAYQMVSPQDLNLDPSRFQYKAADERGVTGALQGTDTWEPALANPVTAYKDVDGKLYVVNGHQRTDLAQRAEAAGQENVQVPARVFDAADGYTPEYMRALGAMQNIAVGSGTAIDAAKILREDLPDQWKLPGLPPKSQLVQQAHGLAALDKDSFGRVVNDIVPAAYAAEVGHAISDPQEQLAAMGVIAKAQPANIEQARLMVQDIKNSGFLQGDQTSLFGDQHIAQSLFAERARILDGSMRQLRQLKNTFGTAINQEGALTQAGNKLSTEANVKARQENENLISNIQTDATRKGQLSDALTGAARELAAGKSAATVTKQFLDSARELVARGRRESVQPGVTAGGNESAPERGQQSITGTEPISDRELAERRMAAPDKAAIAQQAPDEGLFDEGARNQTAMFQRPAAPVFYSQLERGVDSIPQATASADQWQGILKNLINRGVRQDELDWSGVQDWLKEQAGKITKQKLMDFLRSNALEVQEVMKGGARGTELTAEEKNLLSAKLKANDNLGFDTTGEALAAIRSHADWFDRWDVNDTSLRELGDQYHESLQTQNATKFGKHTLPGGDNYRELLLKLPGRADAMRQYEKRYAEIAEAHGRTENPQGYGSYATPEEQAELSRLAGTAEDKKEFTGGHYTEKNVLAHVRFNDRVGSNGEKILHIEEVQSDWHQKGRQEGYAKEPTLYAFDPDKLEETDTQWKFQDQGRTFSVGKGVEETRDGAQDYLQRYISMINKEHADFSAKGIPEAPFKKTWPELAMKRMLRYAAENGYDKLTWTTGAQQAARYDLSYQVKELNVFNNGKGGWDVSTRTAAENKLKDIATGISGEKLADYIGKDLAQRAIKEQTEKGWKTYSGLDLKVSGQGMKGFYDKILPNFMDKYAKKWGSKTEETRIKLGDGAVSGEMVMNTLGVPEDRQSAYWKSLDQAERDQAIKDFREKAGADVHSIDITPAMKESVMGGQPLFSRGAGPAEVPDNAVRVAPGLAAVPKERFNAREVELVQSVNAELQRLLGGNADVTASDRLFSTGEAGAPGEVHGYANRVRLSDGQVRYLVHYALSAEDALGTARHEVIHVLRNTLTPEEWETLARAATDGKWMEKHNVAARWRDLNYEQQLEEAIAEEFAGNRRNQFASVPEFVRPIFEKFQAVLDAVGAAARKVFGKDATAQDIFHHIETGEVGGRPVPGSEERASFRTPEEEKILSKINIGGGETPKGKLSWNQFYRNVVDKFDPVKRINDSMNHGLFSSALNDSYKLLRNLAGNYGRAQHFVEQGTYDFGTYKTNGKSLKEILDPVRDDVNGFRAYAVARRALELDARQIKTGMDINAAKKVITDGAKKFEPIFKELNVYQDSLLKYMKDAGILTDDQLRSMKGANASYVPFYRVMDDENFGAPGGAGRVRNPIKRIKGSERDVIDPLESIVRNTYSYVAMAERNAALQSFYEGGLRQAHPEDYFVEQPATIRPTKVSDAEMQAFLTKEGIQGIPQSTLTVFRAMRTPLAKDEVGFFHKGTWKVLKVDPDVAEAFNATPTVLHNWLFKMMQGPAKALRYGIVTPEFIIRHLERNALSSTVVGEKGGVPFENLYRGMFSYLKKDDWYDDWLKSGGKKTAMSGLSRDDIQDQVRRITHEEPAANFLNKAWNIARTPFDVIHAVQQSLENVNNLGAYKTAMKGLNVSKENIIDSGYYARNVTPDPSRIGASTSLWNSITALANTEIQHSAQIVDAFKNRPLGTLAKGFAYITLPTLINWYFNHDTDQWKEAHAWERDAFWIVPAGGYTLRIPKPFLMGFLFATVPERLMDLMAGDDKHFNGVKEMMKDMFEQATPNMMPNALVPVMEQLANHSFFRNQKLVPDHLMTQLPEFRYSDYTSELTKALGRIAGKVPFLGFRSERTPSFADPVVIDNYLRAWTGTMGTYVKDGMDYSLRKAGVLPDPVMPARALADIPFVRAFVVRYPDAQAASIQQFQDDFHQMSMVTNTFKSLIKQGQVADAQKVMSDNPQAFNNLSRIDKTLTDQNQMVRAIYKNPSIKPDEKRQLIDGIYYQMITLSRSGNSLINSLQESSAVTKH